MNFELSPEDQAFREEVRGFIAANLPPDIARRAARGYHPHHPDAVVWKRILNAKGWAAPSWPQAYGGPGWSPLRRHIFEMEQRAADAPLHDQSAFDLVGPVLYTFGSEAQTARYLPAIRNADQAWCQGFSEPDSGSDLASLKTTAVLHDDHYIVSGQKTWTSEGHKADMMFALVRTDLQVRPQAGISFILIDMKSPGVTVRPIYTINEGHSINEVFLDAVKVPAENLVGEAGQGWTYAKFLLVNERAMSAETGYTAADLAQLKRLAAVLMKGGRPIANDPYFALKVARFETELMALDYAVLRVLHAKAGEAGQDAVASVLKLRGSELRQQVADLALEALGDYGLAVFPEVEGRDNIDHSAPLPPAPDAAAGWLSRAMFRRATTIYGGSNEIQRTLIAKTVLGL